MIKDYAYELNEASKGTIDEDTLNRLIQVTIANIGQNATWARLESYLESKVPVDDPLIDNFHAIVFAFFEESEISKTSNPDGTLHTLSFKDAKTAQAFFAFTQHTFPIIHSEYPQVTNNDVVLTDDQLFFCRRGTKLRTRDLPSELLTDYFLKTLRADQDDFSNKFIKGIIPTSDGTRRLQNLRPTERKEFTILGDGSIRSRTEHAALETTTDSTFTQNQSCTYLGSDAVTPAFGFDKSRQSKLYGILTHRNDLKINRLLLNDGGTISRPFDSSSESDAKSNASSRRGQNGFSLYSSPELNSFIEENSKMRKLKTNTNEALARLRFNVFRAMICICADNFEARLLANEFSEEILEAYAEYVKRKDIQLNPKFKIHVIFYVQNLNPNANQSQPRHHIYRYTRSMLSHDRRTAVQIYHKKSSRAAFINNKNFECLLGLASITEKMLTDPVSANDSTPLAIKMIQSGHVRMLLRLLRPTRKHYGQNPQEQSNLSTTVFNTLIANNRSLLDQTIIFNLIVAEAFEIATQIINATNIETIPTIKILETGNPRHLDFFGLEKTIRLAAENNYWVTVRLCLKEYSNITQETIDHLFVLACKRTEKARWPDIVFLIKKKRVSPATIQSELIKALNVPDMALFEIIITHFNDHEMIREFFTGFSLLETIRNKQHKLAKLILKTEINASWRQSSGQQHALVSTLLFGIQHDFDDLLPQLAEHEKSFQDKHSESRYWLAVDLARARKNNTALLILQAENHIQTLIDPTNIKLSVCYRVFEALFANQPEVAIFRLLDFNKQYHYSPDDSDTPLSVLATLSDEFEHAFLLFKDVLSNHEQAYCKIFFEVLFDLPCKATDSSTIRDIQASMSRALLITELTIEQTIVENSISKLSLDINHELLLSSYNRDPWKNMISSQITYITMPRLISKTDQDDVLFSIFNILKEQDSSFRLDENTEKNLNTFCTEKLFHVIKKNDWDRFQLYLSYVYEIDPGTFSSLLSTAASQNHEIEVKVYDALKNRVQYGLVPFLRDRVIEAAKEMNWSGTRFYLSQIEELLQETLDELLSMQLEPALRDEIRDCWEPKSFRKSINNKLWGAIRQNPPHWDTVLSHLTSEKNHQNYPNFGFALLVAMRDREIGVARKLFSVVKSHQWRKYEQAHQLFSTLFYVVKYQLNDLLMVAYQHEIIDYTDDSKRRIRLAFDLAKLLNNQSAVTFLEDKIDPNPLLDPHEPLKSICLLVFEAYFIGEKELAEWRLFHYGRHFGILPKQSNNIIEGLTILLGAYERVLPHLPYSFEAEPLRCIENLFLYYGNATLSIIMREKTYSAVKVCPCCYEKTASINLFTAIPLNNRASLMEFFKDSNNLDKWLSALISEEVLTSRKDNEIDELIALLESAIFILKQILANKKRYLDDHFSGASISTSVKQIIALCQSRKRGQTSLFCFYQSSKGQEISKLSNQLKETYQLIMQLEPAVTPQQDQIAEPDTDIGDAYCFL